MKSFWRRRSRNSFLLKNTPAGSVRPFPKKRRKETIDLWGPIPGKQMVAQRDNKPCLVCQPHPVGQRRHHAATHGWRRWGRRKRSGIDPRYGPGRSHISTSGPTSGLDMASRQDAIVHYGTHGSLEIHLRQVGLPEPRLLARHPHRRCAPYLPLRNQQRGGGHDREAAIQTPYLCHT